MCLACHSDGEQNYQYIIEKGRIILLLALWIALYTQVEILDCTVYSQMEDKVIML